MIENPLTQFFLDHAGERVYISKKLEKQVRKEMVKADYDRLIVGRTSKEVIRALADKHCASESSIRRILKQK